MTMTPLPKKKYSKAAQGKRRAHLGISPIQLAVCPQCNSPKLFHQVCPTCGTYNGKEIIQVARPQKASK